MKNADKPISPCLMQQVGDSSFRAHKQGDPTQYNIPTEGLTKREYFAAMAMQGLCSAHNAEGEWSTGPKNTAIFAVEYADALLAELEKPTT